MPDISPQGIWNFIWHDDSIWSWIVNVILAFIIVKFLIYPALGAILATDFPVVAVVSGSMHHDQYNFDKWWETNKEWYEANDITKEQFEKFPFKRGFNKGDIMVLYGRNNLEIGDVLVYQSTHPYPIIHRIVEIDENTYTTKGDNNNIPDPSPVTQAQIEHTGKAVLRIPLLGWLKIIVTQPFTGGN